MLLDTVSERLHEALEALRKQVAGLTGQRDVADDVHEVRALLAGTPVTDLDVRAAVPTERT